MPADVGEFNTFFKRQVGSKNPNSRERDECMRSQVFRLGSYTKWPKWAHARPVQLADAGLYYTGTYDEVKCFACNAKFKQWSEINDPMSEHRKTNPNCPFVRDKTQSDDIPLVADVDDIQEINGFIEEAAQIQVEGPPDVPMDDTDGTPERRAQMEAQLKEIEERQNRARYGTDEADEALRQSIEDDQRRREKLKSEAERLKTFTGKWPKPQIIPENALAANGFYYIGPDDRVECIFCGGVLKDWVDGDTVPGEHRRFFPTCNFNLGNYVGNIPIEDPNPLANTRAATDLQTAEVVSSAQGQDRRSGRDVTGRVPFNEEQLGIVKHVMKYPKYALESKRLGTFTNWPTSHHIKPVDLAEAGFFYQGDSDNVRCFFCGMGLGNWEEGDTPWEEHARWFYKCGYLKQVKGDDWIKAIRKKYDEKCMMTSFEQQQSREQRQQLEKLQQERERQQQQMKQQQEELFRQQMLKQQGRQTENQGQQFNLGATGGEGDRPSREATIAAQLSRPQARAILDMGYDKKMVSYIIKKRLERNEPDFPNATEMLEAIFDVEEKINSGELNLDDPDPEPEPQGGATGGPVEGATGGAATPGPSRVTPASKGTKEGKGPSGRLEIPSQATLASGKAPEPVTVDRTEPMDMGEETHGSNTEGDEKDKDDKDKDKDDDEEDVESLKAKVRESNEEKLCKICLERERRLVFLPCGHACSCAICAPGLRTCPMCREIIRGTVRIYFS